MTRRGHNEGSVYKRGDGRWCATLMLPDGRRKSFYGRTKRDVLDKLEQAKSIRARGLPIVAEHQTIEQFLESWLEAKRPRVEYNTWRAAREHASLHIVPTLGKLKLARLTAQQVQALYAALLGKGLSTTTVRHIHVTLKAALRSAVRLDLVARNVAELVDPPRPSEVEMRVLTRDQARAFLAATEGDRLHALFVLALTTGMRRGELLGLQWRDLILAEQTLQVRRSLTRSSQGFRLAEPKTRKSRRMIRLSAPAAEALRQHRARQLEERMHLADVYEDQDLVFARLIGTPLGPSQVTNKHFRPALARAGLPQIRFHDLRHTAATLLLSARVNPKVVSEMLGHASISITLDIYAHVLPDMQQDAAEAMERVFWG